MRAKYKGPGGTGVVSLDDDATVGQLFDEIKKQTGIADFTLKYGWPMQTLSLDTKDANAKELGLSGQSFTIEPAQSTQPSAASSSTPLAARPPPASVPISKKARLDTESNLSPSEVSIPWPDRQSTLLLRVMPDDNSCLFTAFGGALPGKQMEAKELRRMIADYIRKHPEDYSEAVLGMPVDKYCRTMQDPDRWGGAIELSIFSDLFDLEILAFDVKSQTPLKFGENKAARCILVYSGIHYDRVASSPSDPPYTHSDLPPDVDQTTWATSDDEVLEKTKELIRKLHEMHYFTDTVEFLLRCTVPGCDWIGNGEKEANVHASKTGHMGFDEIKDTPGGGAPAAEVVGDSALRKCNAPGCDWLGTSSAEARTHTSQTGHTSMTEIPDF
ncbi:Ubiquitin thioesterase OTU1 [Colletotrichum sidae]|uniref:Ubiquitin thioesterase OTU n=3 Tax=Colletotrichum orbiculare species complex TaxID=2707354 RepID=N4V8P6_COLOR|nr:Ubiquitin thioesterase OTU1 [Colletotrichum orbiculare MAFF 240422]TDZ35121.1 Ubiquitin thioesterase OTU1 [Colletotrichum spinosum]TEA11524.1 Ubiquitin thioesterase OTU1 [Colletotrichum sidae]